MALQLIKKGSYSSILLEFGIITHKTKKKMTRGSLIQICIEILQINKYYSYY
jgi:hypothetical protein